MELTFNIYKAPPTAKQIEEWSDDLQQEHDKAKKQDRKWGKLAVAMGILSVVGCAFLTRDLLHNHNGQFSSSPKLGAVIASVLFGYYKCSRLVEDAGQLAATLKEKLNVLSGIDPLRGERPYSPNVTCNDLICWSEQFPEIRAYLGEVNREGRVPTTWEANGISSWVRTQKSDQARKEKLEMA